MPGVTVLRDTIWVAVFAVALGTVAAAIVLTAGWAPELRDAYGLTPEQPVDIPVLTLWRDNALVMTYIGVATIAVSLWPAVRFVTDAVVIFVLGLNLINVSVAFAAYGGPLLRLAPGHYVLELVAVCVAAAMYLDARRNGWRPDVLAWCVAVIAVALLGAAVLESNV